MIHSAQKAIDALGLPCAACDKRIEIVTCGAQSAAECPASSPGDVLGIKARGLKLLKALAHVEAAIASIGAEGEDLKALDDLLDALRELEALAAANRALEAATAA